jgi:hypothetical protein
MSLCAGLAMLAGCGFSGVVPQRASTATNAPAVRDASWISPAVGVQDLLYVSDVGTGKVNIYSYPSGNLVGRLAGFQRPQAMCVNKYGEVFVPDLQAFKVYAYRHGAKKPTAVLSDPGQDPDDCAVDPTTGALAVANLSTPYSGPGDLVVYAHGKRTEFRDPHIRYYLFCGYDNQGNLYVDGMSSGSFKFAELPKGSTNFVDITLSKHIRFGGAVQWDGRNVAVGDYESNVIYQFKINGRTGTEVGETRLNGSDYAIGFWIEGSRVIGPNDDSTSVMFWNYPAGGTRTKSISGLHTPWGAVVSLAK